MDFNNALNKAQDLAKDNPEQVEKVVDQTSEQVKERTPDNVNAKVDDAAKTAKDQLGLDKN